MKLKRVARGALIAGAWIFASTFIYGVWLVVKPGMPYFGIAIVGWLACSVAWTGVKE